MPITTGMLSEKFDTGVTVEKKFSTRADKNQPKGSGTNATAVLDLGGATINDVALSALGAILIYAIQAPARNAAKSVGKPGSEEAQQACADHLEKLAGPDGKIHVTVAGKGAVIDYRADRLAKVASGEMSYDEVIAEQEVFNRQLKEAENARK